MKKVKTTLILAHQADDEQALFFAKHSEEIDVKQAARAAFTAWSKTKDGAKFIEQNGGNWGDAISIPTKFLKLYGISKLDSLHGPNEIRGLKYDDEIRVEHDEYLVDGGGHV